MPRRKLLGILKSFGESLASWLRNYFLTGVILLVPVVLTLFILFQLFLWADGFLGAWVSRGIGYHIPGLGIFLTALLVVLTGVIGQNVLGKRLWRWVEYSLESLPVIRSLYVGIKQVFDTMFQKRASDFQRVVLIEYPRAGTWVIGFVTNDQVAWIQAAQFHGKKMATVFVPTTPNPTSGFMLLLETSQMKETCMGIEDAMKVVFSGGLVQGKVPMLPQRPPTEFTVPH